MLVALPPINENISFAINRQFSMLDEDHYHFSYRHHLNAKHFYVVLYCTMYINN